MVRRPVFSIYVVLAAVSSLAAPWGTLNSATAAVKKKTKSAPQSVPTPVATPVPAVTQQVMSLPAPASEKVPVDTLLKAKSLARVAEDYDIVTNAEWRDDDFAFVNAVLVRTPMEYAQPKMLDFSLYPKISSAIKKMEFNPKTQILEMIGETHGLYMHSWVHVEHKYLDVIHYEIVRGDMTGFKIDAYLWNRNGKTLTVAKGYLPHAKQLLPTLVALIFKPVSEIVLGVATKNFRSYIEEEYKKEKTK
ncbi:MAG: hypothetical protein HY074_03830 [Deltaproteobacteria bacterium]|nr:hypothetical protein [Deltaproteobacteria bacterium]